MQRHVGNPVVIPENLFGAVAMMHVVIDDQHAFALGGQRGRSHRDVVDQTESHCLTWSGMMPRWAHSTKRRIAFAGAQSSNRIQPGARREQRNGIGVGDGAGVSVKLAATGQTHMPQPLQVQPVVHPFDIDNFGRGGELRRNDLIEPGLGDAPADGEQPTGRFRVKRTRNMVKKPFVCEIQDRHTEHVTASPYPHVPVGCPTFPVMRPTLRIPAGPYGLYARWWDGDATTAVMRSTALPRTCPPTMINDALDALAQQGVRRVLTGALHYSDTVPFALAGFAVCEELRLMRHDLDHLDTCPIATRRGRLRRDLAQSLEIDHAAFGSFWRFSVDDVKDALHATPSSRYRVVGLPDAPRAKTIAGYAISGRFGQIGYLQRLAVAPDVRRQGLATALVLDALRWMRRYRATSAMVNTQLVNDQARELYEHLGFVEENERLSILSYEFGAA